MSSLKTVVESSPKATPIVKEFEPMKEKKVTLNLVVIFAAVFIIILGGISGFILSKNKVATSGSSTSSNKSGSNVAKIVGASDEKTFKDSAEGVLTAGGIDNEGSHHLERPGGDSQNVYLTSSSVPLDDYVGKKVKVWGQTFSSEKAGWLMDVGRLELLE